MIAAKTFKALGDPIRLELIQRLANSSTHTLGSLSDGLGLTRQGTRKHLQVLVDGGLVTLTATGRQTKVVINLQTLSEAKSFISGIEQQWDERLQKLRTVVEGN